ncbi:MAG TPA: hypothetical protein V6C52_01815 [Coleofasciculaceae cyanobacterium]|jgi:hypothetical protein
MSQLVSFGKKISKIDCALYVVSALLGVAIVVSNYHTSTVDTSQVASGLDRYMEKIITRMDSVSGQLGAWGAIDIRKETGGY